MSNETDDGDGGGPTEEQNGPLKVWQLRAALAKADADDEVYISTIGRLDRVADAKTDRAVSLGAPDPETEMHDATVLYSPATAETKGGGDG